MCADCGRPVVTAHSDDERMLCECATIRAERTTPTDPTAPRPEAGPDFDTPLAKDERFVDVSLSTTRDRWYVYLTPEAAKSDYEAGGVDVRRVRVVPSSPPSGGATGEREASADDLMTLRSLHIENPPDKPWSVKAGFDGPAAEMFAAALCDFYRKSGGENYVEMHMRDPASPSEEFVVTVQRKAGKTPHELRREAEAALAAFPREATGVSEAMAKCDSIDIDGRYEWLVKVSFLNADDAFAFYTAALDAGRTP